MDCAALEAMGVGTYTAEGSIVVYDAGGNRINIIPFVVTVTVTASQTDPNTTSGVSLSNPDPGGLNCPGAKLLSKDAGGVELEVYKLNDGFCYDHNQFLNPTTGEKACEEDHYHAPLVSLDGSNVRQDSQPCGAAVRSDVIANGIIWIEGDSNSGGANSEILIDSGATIDTAGNEIIVPSGGSIEVRGGIFGE